MIVQKGDLNQERNERSHILGSIYISDYVGASCFEGRKICVHHDCSLVTDLHIPLLLRRPNSDIDRSGAKVNRANLSIISDLIEKHFKSNLPLCVHCKGGVERSPLAVVYWLNTRRGYNWEDAYQLVREKRSVVEDRSGWM